VKFEVVTGAFSIKSNDPANPLVTTLTVVSDVTAWRRSSFRRPQGFPRSLR
jgi:hypothetical protein